MLKFPLLSLMATVALASPSAAETVQGVIRIVDADTFWLGDTKVRLHGVDAQERAQTCTLADGSVWACGQWATEQARDLYDGKSATCTRTDTDRYGRMVARCAVAGRDVGATLVLAGVATAYRRYSMDYIDAEKKALFAGRGIWRGDFQSPAEYRAQARIAAPAPDASCAIKGNISGNGKIYHMPGQEHYRLTKINATRGERWFCSEDEARAAGWRRAKR